MENILTMNQTMFGNKFIERRASKRTRKAQATEFEFSENVVEMTYDECDVVDGGVGIIQAIGLVGSGLSIAATMLLMIDDFSSKFNMSWGWRLALKIVRFVGDIASTVSFMSNALKGQIANVVAKIVCGKSGLILDANIIAGMAKSYSLFSHFTSFFK